MLRSSSCTLCGSAHIKYERKDLEIARTVPAGSVPHGKLQAPQGKRVGNVLKRWQASSAAKKTTPARKWRNPRCACARVLQELLGRSPMTVTSSSSVSGVPNSCSYGSAPRGISDLELLEQLPVGGAGSDSNSAPVPSCFFLLLLSLQPFSFFLHSHVLELLHHFCLSPLYPPIFLFALFQFSVSG